MHHLERAGALTVKVLVLTYAFDPFMHHGPYYIAEIDLGWYPNALFPPLLFGIGIDVVEPAEELAIEIRSSDDVTFRMLGMFEKFFTKWLSKSHILKNNYDLEWLLGNAMILPAIYLQGVTGEFQYKKYTFPIAKKHFTRQEWEPIERASLLRATLEPRSALPSGIVTIAREVRWPGLLRIWGRYHPASIRRAKKATKQLGENYPESVLKLLNIMKTKLDRVHRD